MSLPLRPAVFVDRDGTLMVERDYLSDPEGVALIPGAVEALHALRTAGYALVVVTNQSGIARGLYSVDDYQAVARRLDELLDRAGAPVDGTYYCPHHPDVTGPCACRKPGTGMYVQAAADLGLDLESSWYVGDKVSDVLPAATLGGRGILVRTGYGSGEEAQVPAWAGVADDLAAGAVMILAADGASGVDPPGAPG